MKINDAFRLIENPRDALIFVSYVLLLGALFL